MKNREKFLSSSTSYERKIYYLKRAQELIKINICDENDIKKLLRISASRW